VASHQVAAPVFPSITDRWKRNEPDSLSGSLAEQIFQAWACTSTIDVPPELLSFVILPFRSGKQFLYNCLSHTKYQLSFYSIAPDRSRLYRHLCILQDSWR